MIKTLLVLTAVLAISSATVVPRVGPIVSHVPLTYNVSLEDSLEDRWRPILNDFK